MPGSSSVAAGSASETGKNLTDLSIGLRRRLVQAYQSKQSGTYAATAALFSVGEATVSRLLRRFRQSGDVKYRPNGGYNPRRVDMDWLREHLAANPDVRLVDRIEAWLERSGKRVGIGAMWLSVRACGWSHKKTVVAREQDRPEVQAKRGIHHQPSQSRPRAADLPRRIWPSARLASALRMGSRRGEVLRQSNPW